MFNPRQLTYCGRKQGVDTFYYNGIRIDAALSREDNESYLYVGFSGELAADQVQGLLAWFGLDRCRQYSRYRFTDNSCYYVQRQPA